MLGSGDKAFRLMTLSSVREVVEPGTGEGSAIEADLSLRDAYSEMLWSGRDVLPVVSEGKPVGIVSRTALDKRAARPQ